MAHQGRRRPGTAAATACWHWAGSVTSVAMGQASPPLALDGGGDFLEDVLAAQRRTTRAPKPANRKAAARPMPDEAPVSRIVLPRKGSILAPTAQPTFANGH